MVCLVLYHLIEYEIWKIAAHIAERHDPGVPAPVLYVSGEEVSNLLSDCVYLHAFSRFPNVL